MLRGRGWSAELVGADLSWRAVAVALKGLCRLRLVARFGVGLDRIDVGYCTTAGVMVTTTPQGVARPVASGELALILALAHRLLQRDRQIRDGRWADGRRVLGTGLAGRILASIGFGNIAQELFRLARPFGMVHLGQAPRARSGCTWSISAPYSNQPTFCASTAR